MCVCVSLSLSAGLALLIAQGSRKKPVEDKLREEEEEAGERTALSRGDRERNHRGGKGGEGESLKDLDSSDRDDGSDPETQL